MAITISTTPNSKSIAYRPIVFEVTSDRNNSSSYSVTGVSSGTGAKARYAMASHTFLVGDTLTGSGFSVSAYNVKQVVTVVNASWVETNVDYSANATGTLTRTNTNFQVKGEVIVFDGTRVNIASVASAGTGLSEITTSSAHGYVAGDYASQEGTTNYNGLVKVLTIVSATKYTVAKTYISTQTGTTRKGTVIAIKRMDDISISGTLTFRFSIADNIKSVLTPDLIAEVGGNIYNPCTNSIKYYGMNFTEEYDDKDGLLKSGDEKLSGQYLAIRASLQHTDSQTLTDKYILGSTTKKFLSNAPRRYIRIGDDEQLSFIINQDMLQVFPEYYVYDDFGVMGTVVGFPVYIFDYKAIIRIHNALVSGTSRLDVRLKDFSGNVISETVTYIVERNCNINARRVKFENYLGGFDSFIFTDGLSQLNNSKRNTFQKDLGLSFSLQDRGYSSLAVKADTDYVVKSRILTTDEGIWLQELLNSPNVYVETEAGFLPIIILNSSDTVYDSGIPVQIVLKYRLANSPITLTN